MGGQLGKGNFHKCGQAEQSKTVNVSVRTERLEDSTGSRNLTVRFLGHS